MAPQAARPTAPAVDAGTTELLNLFRPGEPLSRADVGQRTGWARATVNVRLDRAVDAGLLVDAGMSSSARGRPASRFRFNAGRARLLLADIGASGMRLAACDLSGRILLRTDRTISVAEGPDVVLPVVEEGLAALLDGRDSGPVWGVGVSVPGPVEFATGTVVNPPIMIGWDGVSIPPRLQHRFGAAVFVDNDVNAMAMGERVTTYPEVADLLFVKVGTGVGAGIVANGLLLRGAQGAAGDLGHLRADVEAHGGPEPLCRCGQLGCVEAYAGGWAILRDLVNAGRDASTVEDVIAAVRNGDPVATRLVREAGRVLGASLADAVGLLNPSVIVVGGQLSDAGEHLLAGIRERIYSRSLPLAMRNLRIAPSKLSGDAGILGLAHGLSDVVFTTENLERALVS